MKAYTTSVTDTLQNKVQVSAFCTDSTGGAATTTEQPLEASKISTKAEDPVKKVTNRGIYTYIWNTSQRHLHPYQPDQISASSSLNIRNVHTNIWQEGYQKTFIMPFQLQVLHLPDYAY